jgi:hypothetical protein
LQEPAARLGGALLLLCTQGGAALSAASSAASPLALVPGGPKPLPFVGNMPVFLRVSVLELCGPAPAC